MRTFQDILAATAEPHGATFTLEDGWTMRIALREPWLLRIVVAPAAGLPLDRTWMVAPEGDTPWEGRNRDATEGFSKPPFALTSHGERHDLEATDIRVAVTANPVRLSVEMKDASGAWRRVLSDRESGAYVLAEAGRRLRHYQDLDPRDRYFGLGDKTGPVDRHGRRFRLLQLDALGYDAELGDPLYKHVPFFMVRTADAVTTGLFYDTLTPMTVDLGNERSNYHGRYRYVEIEEPGLDLYVIGGPSVADVTERFARLTGRPHLPPRWSFGFAFTSMHHADHSEGQRIIGEFAQRCRDEAIPISAIHFGSGYSSRGRRRYVFTWNSDKFPEPRALFARLRDMQLKTVANLKPVLIDDHPAYAELKDAHGFIEASPGTPVVEQFWDGHGSFLDFTNRETVAWWQQQLTAQVLDVGFDAVWNDNNEYEAWREGAMCRGFGRPIPIEACRPLHALLMTRASFEETQRREPTMRPFTITRAGPPGIQRYAETWSGDNETSWHTLKWNLRNGLSLSLSGMGKVGHDIGGFAGPPPDAELLTRFVEMMALHPRALMNSWKPSADSATEPWTHPGATAAIRAALNLRYRFLPLLYSRAWLAHRTGAPIIAPLFYHHEHDPRSFEDHDAFMLGPDVLVAPVVQPGATTRDVYLPAGPEGWVDFHDGTRYPAGVSATVAAQPGRLPVFVRVGAALLLAGDIPLVRPHDAPARSLYLVPGFGDGGGGGDHFEDDGESWGLRSSACLALRLGMTWDRSTVSLAMQRTGGDWPVFDTKGLRIEAPTLGGRAIVWGV